MDPVAGWQPMRSEPQTPLDLLALATLLIVMVPATDFSTAHDVRAAVLALQGAARLSMPSTSLSAASWPAAMCATCPPTRWPSPR
jgi:hypothetical protein